VTTESIPIQEIPKPPSETFCVLPWVHLFVGEVGTLRPCCMTLEARDLVNRDAAGNPHLIYAPDSISSAWNSGYMRTLRGEMLNGQRPAACRRCFREEDLGIRSYRQYANEDFAAHIPEAVQKTSAQCEVPVDMIRSLDLRLGNRCNLKCRMCSPVSSRALAAEYAELYDISPDDPRLLALVGEDWVSDPNFIRAFEECSEHVEKLLFAGGEPLLVREMEVLLRGLIERGLSSRIDLRYVTNLTVLPEKFFPLWAAFRSVGFVVSLDGLGPIAEFIRYPLRWKSFERNLKALDARANSIDCRNLHANITVQAYNVLHVEEMLIYVAEQLQHFARPKLSLLFFPEHLNVRVLPDSIKRLATERLRRLGQRCQAEWRDRWPNSGAAEVVDMINGIIEHMNGADRSDLLPEFRRWTQVLDRSRHEDAAKAIPELASLMA
jgi:MoaA/NifB/PqqE/SkfB family radical SAM enzyme